MLDEQIQRAKRALVELKHGILKYMLPEYGELQRAQREFDDAKARLQRAQEAWNRLGE